MQWKAFKETLLTFSYSQRIFLVIAAVCNFLVAFDYGIIRPISNSIFLSAYTNSSFPYVWLAVVPFNFLIVSLYNKFLRRIGIFKMFVVILTTLMVVNTFCSFFMEKLFFLPFFFYLWKEIYVMLLLQQLWSVIHSTIKFTQAKLVYGLIFAIGGMGGVIGSFTVELFAVKIGSDRLLLCSLPIFIVLLGMFAKLLQYSSVAAYKKGEETQSSSLDHQSVEIYQGLKSIKNSRQLTFILMIVLLMQVVSTLAYYQFNSSMQLTIPDRDLRAAFCGKILAIVNMGTVFFQLIGAFLFVHLFGLRRSHLLLPLILGINALGCLLIPGFIMTTFSFVVTKTFDFSLFSVLKEMLYVNLKEEEKFQAKAIIDVFVYRSAKAFASCLILGFQFFSHSHLYWLISIGNLFILIFWATNVYKRFDFKETTPSTTTTSS